MQTTNKVFMVRPIRFGFNTQTAANNEFQNNTETADTQRLAKGEFDAYVDLLRSQGVEVAVAEDTAEPFTPDSIFPNNWFSTHEDGTLVLYPMYAPNRRAERKEQFLREIREKCSCKRVVDLTSFEQEGLFLEGTGSMVLDRENRICYACRSPRTDEKVLRKFCDELGYRSIVFDAFGRNGMRIYHTNVLLTIGTDFAVVCLNSISDEEQRQMLIQSFGFTGKQIVAIDYDQLEHYAGNMLEIRSENGKRFLVMSETARESLTKEQLKFLSERCDILVPSIPTIENIGGGSARCMMAELF